MNRIEVNVQTGEKNTIPLTPPEIATRQANATANRPHKVRRDRDLRLRNEVGSIGAVQWASMLQVKRDQWIQYRQDLLDVPQQPGFPDTIDWPITPV